MRFTSRWNWNLEMLVFMEGGKPEYPEKNPRSKDENQQQTQPTYDTRAGNRNRATLVEGECSHHCAIPAPLVILLVTLCWVPCDGLPSHLAGSSCNTSSRFMLHKNLDLSKLATVTKLKANFASVRPSSEGIKELWVVHSLYVEQWISAIVRNMAT